MEKSIEPPKTVYIYPNGSISCRDSQGNVIDELQESWITLYFQFLESKGINPLDIPIIETTIDGETKYIRPVKLKNGWNWTLSEKYR